MKRFLIALLALSVFSVSAFGLIVSGNYGLTTAEGNALWLRLDTTNDPLQNHLDGTSSRWTGNLTVEGNLQVLGTIEGSSPVKMINGLNLWVEDTQNVPGISINQLDVTNDPDNITLNYNSSPYFHFNGQMVDIFGNTDGQGFWADDGSGNTTFLMARTTGGPGILHAMVAVKNNAGEFPLLGIVDNTGSPTVEDIAIMDNFRGIKLGSDGADTAAGLAIYVDSPDGRRFNVDGSTGDTTISGEATIWDTINVGVNPSAVSAEIVSYISNTTFNKGLVFRNANTITASNEFPTVTTEAFSWINGDNAVMALYDDRDLGGMGLRTKGLVFYADDFTYTMPPFYFAAVDFEGAMGMTGGFVSFGPGAGAQGIFMHRDRTVTGETQTTIGTSDIYNSGSVDPVIDQMDEWILIAGQRRILSANPTYPNPSVELANYSTHEVDILGTNSNWQVNVSGEAFFTQIGISTSEPQAKLHITNTGTSENIIATQNIDDWASIRISNPNAGTNAAARFVLDNGTAVGGYSIHGVNYTFPEYANKVAMVAESTADGLVFSAQGAGDDITFIAGGPIGVGMTYDSTGLGIGTAPAYPLTVYSTADGSATVFGTYNHFDVTAPGGGVAVALLGMSELSVAGTQFVNTGVQARAVNSSTGTINIGVGMVSDVDNTSTGTIELGVGLAIENFDNSGGGTFTDIRQIYLNDQTTAISGIGYGIYQETASFNNYFAGNVGIGSSEPTSRLEVVGSSASATGSFRQNGTGDIVEFLDSTGFKRVYVEDNGALFINTGLTNLPALDIDPGNSGAHFKLDGVAGDVPAPLDNMIWFNNVADLLKVRAAGVTETFAYRSDFNSALNTLDIAYDGSGSGQGRTIEADSGPVYINGDLVVTGTIEGGSPLEIKNGVIAYVEDTQSVAALVVNQFDITNKPIALSVNTNYAVNSDKMAVFNNGSFDVLEFDSAGDNFEFLSSGNPDIHLKNLSGTDAGGFYNLGSTSKGNYTTSFGQDWNNNNNLNYMLAGGDNYELGFFAQPNDDVYLGKVQVSGADVVTDAGISVMANRNVGIGIITPLTKLHIKDDVITSAQDLFRIDETISGPAERIRFIVQDGGNTGIRVGNPLNALHVAGNAAFGLGYNASTAPVNGMIIEGQVGIGTNEPQAKLHIEGDLKVTGTLEVVANDLLVTAGNVGFGTSTFGPYSFKVASGMSSFDNHIHLFGNGTDSQHFKFFTGIASGTGMWGQIRQVGPSAGTTYMEFTGAGKKFSFDGKVGIGTSVFGASSILTLNSTTEGFLPSRMTTPQRDVIATPATGLQVYNTTDNINDVYNGSTWESVDVSRRNFTWVYDTTIQQVAVGSTFQDVTFDTNAELNGWTHSTGSALFTAEATGKYKVDFDCHPYKAGGPTADVVVKGVFNGVDIAGATAARAVTSNNDLGSAGASFIIDVTAGQEFKLQIASNTTVSGITPATLYTETIPSISMTITKIN